MDIINIIIKFLRNAKLHTKYKAQCAYLIAKIRISYCINISMEYVYHTVIENDWETYFAKRSVTFEFFNQIKPIPFL